MIKELVLKFHVSNLNYVKENLDEYNIIIIDQRDSPLACSDHSYLYITYLENNKVILTSKQYHMNARVTVSWDVFINLIYDSVCEYSNSKYITAKEATDIANKNNIKYQYQLDKMLKDILATAVKGKYSLKYTGIPEVFEYTTLKLLDLGYTLSNNIEGEFTISWVDHG